MTTQFVPSDGVQLFTETVGDGPPLLMLNGGPGFPHDYLEETKSLADVARLHFFDQRGTGQSGCPEPPDYTIDANVRDVEAVRQTLVDGPCACFGHSWGGMLAQAYAVQFPQNVTKLILADTFSNIQDLNTSLQRMRAAVPPDTEAMYRKWEEIGLYADGRDRYPDEYQAALDTAYEPVNLSVPAPPYLEAAFSKLSYPVYRAMWGEDTEFRVTGTLTALDVEHHFSRLTMPTLVMVGASDMATVEMAQRTTSLLPNATLEVFEHTRHFPFLEEPDKFGRVLRDFLQG